MLNKHVGPSTFDDAVNLVTHRSLGGRPVKPTVSRPTVGSTERRITQLGLGLI